MNIVFRVDSSLTIGTGHVMRCMTLAQELKDTLNASCYFFVRDFDGNVNELIKERSFYVVELAVDNATGFDDLEHSAWLGSSQYEDSQAVLSNLTKLGIDKVELVVVDHYAIDSRWEDAIKPVADKIFVIDDLGDRTHRCDYLFDQTFNCNDEKYQNLITSECKLFLGTKYALLRKEFSHKRSRAKILRKTKTEKVKILVTLGGVDKSNLISKVLKALSYCNSSVSITVITGHQNRYQAEIEKEIQTLKHDVKIIKYTSDISEFMLDADICIGAAGSTSWERCALGLPTINLVIADNQNEIAESLENFGATINFGVLEQVRLKEFTKVIDNLVEDDGLRNSLSDKSFLVCDGLGVERVVRALSREL